MSAPSSRADNPAWTSSTSSSGSHDGPQAPRTAVTRCDPAAGTPTAGAPAAGAASDPVASRVSGMVVR